MDRYFNPLAQFNETLFQRLIANAIDGVINIGDVVQAQQDRIYQSQRTNSHADFHEKDILTQLVLEKVALMRFLGDYPSLESVQVDYLRSFLESNRIPDGFIPPNDRNRTLLTDFEVGSISRVIMRQVEAAIKTSLTPTTPRKADNTKPSKEPPVNVVLEDLRLYMKDYGNGKVVTHVPDRPLERFFENIGTGIFPLSHEFYAGTNGALKFSIDDLSARYTLLLQPKPERYDKKKLADPGDIFDRLLRRDTFIPERRAGANMLLVSFANWFLDEIFRTEPHTGGSLFRFPTPAGESTCGINNSFRLAIVYGTDSYRERALRAFRGGKMKTGSDGGLPTLPQIRRDYDGFNMVCGWNRTDRSCYNDGTFYATGHERFNFHPGHIVFTELFLREHNHVAELLQDQNPNWDDARLFETTRTIMVHLLSKFILNEYVSLAVAPSQKNVMLGYDPERFREMKYDKLQSQTSLEFNHLYRWHSLVAEQLMFEDEELVNFEEFLWQPRLFNDRGGAPSIARALHRTGMGALQAHNTPAYLRDVSIRTIIEERSQSLQGYNEYRQFFTLSKLEAFEDLQAGPEATRVLKELYASVDDIDLFVGAQVEQRFTPGTTFLSEFMLVSIASLAFSGILNFDVIKDPHLYSEERMTRFGIDYIQSVSMADLFDHHLGIDNLHCGTPLLNEGTCDFVQTPLEWSRFNMVDHVGLDFVLEPFYQEEDFFYQIFTVSLSSNVIVFAMFFAVHHIMTSRRFGSFYTEMEPYEQFRFAYGVVNITILLVTTIPYTYMVMLALFGPDFMGAAEQYYLPLFSFFHLHGILYAVETCCRLMFSQSGSLLLFHHSLWFVMIIVALSTRSVFMLKVDFLLDVMVSFEAGLFVALMLRRYSENVRLRRRATVWASSVFLVTRVVQSVLLVYLFVQSAPRMTNSAGQKAIYAFAVICSAVLSLLQFYMLTIYYGFYVQDSATLTGERPPQVESASSSYTKGEATQEDGTTDVTEKKDITPTISDQSKEKTVDQLAGSSRTASVSSIGV